MNENHSEFHPEQNPEHIVEENTAVEVQDSPVEEAVEPTSDSHNGDDFGRFDYQKAETVARGAEANGFAGEKDDDWRNNQVELARLNEIVAVDKDANYSASREFHRQRSFEMDVSRAEAVEKSLKDQAINPFVELYDANPELFASMPTSEYIEKAREYEKLNQQVLISKETLRIHSNFIRRMNGILESRDSRFIEPAVEDHQAGASDPYGDTDTFTLSDVFEAVKNKGPEKAKSIFTEDRPNQELTDVIDEVARLQEGFDVSAHDRAVGYRDLVINYWTPKAEDVLKQRSEAKEAFKSKFSPDSSNQN